MEAKGKPRRERVSFVSMNETGEDETEEPMTGFDQDEDEDPLFLQEVVGTTQRNTYIKTGRTTGSSQKVWIQPKKEEQTSADLNTSASHWQRYYRDAKSSTNQYTKDGLI